MERIAQLSDDEGDTHQNLQAVHALSDEEGAGVPQPAIGNGPRKRKADTAAAVNVYDVRVAVSKIIRKRCICSRRSCLQQFAEEASAEDLVQLRCELRTLDKRDADAKVPCFQK